MKNTKNFRNLFIKKDKARKDEKQERIGIRIRTTKSSKNAAVFLRRRSGY